MLDLIYNRDFEVRLLINLLADDALFGKLAPDLHLDDFGLSGCRLIFEIARDYHVRSHKLPPFSTVEFETLQYLQGHCTRYETQVSPAEYESVATILGMIAGTPVSQLDPNYFAQHIRDFIMHARMLLIESQGLPVEQKLARIIQTNEELNRAQGSDIKFYSGMAPVEASQSSERERYPTGMMKIDRLLMGGIARRQNGVIIAGTGVGKTNFFLNCHVATALLDDLSLDIALEMERGPLQERYQAMMAHIEAGWFANPGSTQFDPATSWRHKIAMMPEFPYNDRFDIADYNATYITLEQVRQIIIRWKEYRDSLGDNVDEKCVLVTLDYADKLLHDGLPGISKSSNTADKLAKVAEGLAVIAREQNVALWTASQINSSGMGREVLDVQHAANCKHRSDATDIALGLAPVSEENNVASEFGNDDGPSTGVACDRTLNCTIMKSRGTAATGMSAKTYQGPTLKYWEKRDSYSEVSKMLRGNQDLDRFYKILNRTPTINQTR